MYLLGIKDREIEDLKAKAAQKEEEDESVRLREEGY